jgi:hypothetical protein
LPAITLFSLGYEPVWAASAMVIGFLAVWGMFTSYFRLRSNQRNADFANATTFTSADRERC